MVEENHSYEDGLREGRIISLEKAVTEITTEFRTLKVSIYMLYGAIALVQFLPDVRRFFGAD
jgi:hypothetical protein